MGIRLLTRTADRIELVAPTDDAVDQATLARWEAEASELKKPRDNDESPDPEFVARCEASAADLARFRAYCRGESRDVSVLPRLPGVEPVKLVVRPLNSRELAIALSDGGRNWGALNYDLVRLGLVELRGLDAVLGREDYHGIHALTLDSVGQLPPAVVQFLASHILKASTLPPF